MSQYHLEFEKPIIELEEKIAALQSFKERSSDLGFDPDDEIACLRKKCEKLTQSIYADLGAWEIVRLARHPLRPYTLDYISLIFTDFQALAGDRAFADDKAIVGGLARLEGRPVMVIGHQKGRDTKEKLLRNFGMPSPEGYRKALRQMKIAERFHMPVLMFIDSAGAYPGVGAEERGQAEAIARNLLELSRLKTPVICSITGEGCSGGALGIGVGDRINMLQYSTYAAISPEGCASILWKSADKAPQAAETMGMTAPRLKALGIIDTIIPEPAGGAHRNYQQAADNLREQLLQDLAVLSALPEDELLAQRYQKLMSFGYC
ncbi:acetyl-CoA carboxylase carboxyl transferase subunit alpha [Morganella morganii subsp. morganii]|uniref:Acetyl-coenzyme A carboxylase carboxyl transferase subunit alpha n=1 Tax=Salmonella enterica subsp. enterica serovar Chester TaxID=149386 RepID=A0A5U8SUR1_SALET|nr:acetyl-CoA carboxylase carboxyl transferase subunit alpha [Morganella morganii]EBR9859395.1 acetyl-CoA carboxylase carboxyl transferase subunit alpha [Salmonella enterica subsp. enterica serovar Chester]ELA8474550.1 acetyl-CoA carboxylase carboxyl transferase subunit alpha [Morganella morganii]MBA5854914.1 acetyl-CoA carboxylase carboxyl transferase subunit alpha [Morganella morganii]MBT0447597.1 acetyl-CoA carboxylase carboxyl transferase subunit alpha [Morganella morganii subsp. morganii]